MTNEAILEKVRSIVAEVSEVEVARVVGRPGRRREVAVTVQDRAERADRPYAGGGGRLGSIPFCQCGGLYQLVGVVSWQQEEWR